MSINLYNSSMIIEDLMVFLAVVENGSFTDAADMVGISKSMVSKRVTRLESELETSLLIRSTRNLTLTERGSQLSYNARKLRDRMHSVFEAATADDKQLTGTLRINAPMSFGNLHLVPAAAQFMKQNPSITIELLLGAKYENLIACDIDLAVRIGEQQDSTLMARRLMCSRLAVCATPEYWDTYGRPSKPAELADHNCLLYHSSPTGNSWHFNDGTKDMQIPVSGNLIASSAQALESAALEGLGVIYLPDYMMVNEIASGQLERVLISDSRDMLKVFVVYPEMKYVPLKLRLFIDFLVEYSKEHCVTNIDDLPA